MSVADIIIMLVRILLAPLIMLLPTSISWFPVEDWLEALNNSKPLLITSLSGLGFILPVRFFFGLILLIISAEFTLFLFKSAKWILKLVRG